MGLRDREIVELKLEIAAKEALIKRYQKMLFGSLVMPAGTKYYSHQPTNRTRKRFESKKLKVSQGTITNGHKKIHQQIKHLPKRFADSLIKDIKRYSRLKNHWHIDDTGWKVFVKRKDREGFGWYLWFFRSSDVCVYILDPSRGKFQKGI